MTNMFHHFCRLLPYAFMYIYIRTNHVKVHSIYSNRFRTRRTCRAFLFYRRNTIITLKSIYRDGKDSLFFMFFFFVSYLEKGKIGRMKMRYDPCQGLFISEVFFICKCTFNLMFA